MTFAEFQDKLGDDFIRIHRGGLVAAKAVHCVNNLITLSNGVSLEYSALHREEIMRKFRRKQCVIIDAILGNDNPTENEEYHKHYQCFDTIPIAFTDIEMIFDEESQEWESSTDVPCNSYRTSTKEVVIGDGVTSIENRAFTNVQT